MIKSREQRDLIMASNTNNNFSPWLQSSQISSWVHDAVATHPYDNESTELPVFFRTRSTAGTTEDADHIWRLTEEYGLPPGFFTLSSFPGPQQSGTRVAAVNNNRRGLINPRHRQVFQQESTPRIIGQTSFQFPRFIGQTRFQFPNFEETPRLTADEQDEALRKLKKENYSPASSWSLPKRPSLYHMNHAKNEDEVMEKELEDGKSCVICLEDFKPGEQVVVTPCKHMFHEDCVVPWVKSHGQCPVCRLAINETARENPTSSNTNNDVHGSLRRSMNGIFI